MSPTRYEVTYNNVTITIHSCNDALGAVREFYFHTRKKKASWSVKKIPLGKETKIVMDGDEVFTVREYNL